MLIALLDVLWLYGVFNFHLSRVGLNICLVAVPLLTLAGILVAHHVIGRRLVMSMASGNKSASDHDARIASFTMYGVLPGGQPIFAGERLPRDNILPLAWFGFYRLWPIWLAAIVSCIAADRIGRFTLVPFYCLYFPTYFAVRRAQDRYIPWLYPQDDALTTRAVELARQLGVGAVPVHLNSDADGARISMLMRRGGHVLVSQQLATSLSPEVFDYMLARKLLDTERWHWLQVWAAATFLLASTMLYVNKHPIWVFTYIALLVAAVATIWPARLATAAKDRKAAEVVSNKGAAVSGLSALCQLETPERNWRSALGWRVLKLEEALQPDFQIQ